MSSLAVCASIILQQMLILILFVSLKFVLAFNVMVVSVFSRKGYFELFRVLTPVQQAFGTTMKRIGVASGSRGNFFRLRFKREQE